MKHSIEELIELCYRYYPRGVPDDDLEAYRATEEYRRLVAARKRAGSEDSPWRPMLRYLATCPPERSVENASPHLPMGSYDGGYVGRWNLSRPEHWKCADYLYFSVSFLAPYYILYTEKQVVAGEQGSPIIRRFASLLPEEEALARTIAAAIEKFFPGHEPMPISVGRVIVPEIVVDTRRMGEAPLYQCLFTELMSIKPEAEEQVPTSAGGQEPGAG